MSKHTPGPWAAYVYGKQNRPGVDAAGQSIVLWGDASEIEDDGGVRGHDPEEARANAYLIAAAPVMLQALEAAEFVMRNELADPEDSGAYQAVVAAIAKAKGEA